MKSIAATWAGHGAPPPLSAGDVAAMAAPVAGFDASLSPGWKLGGSIESSNTSATKERHDAMKPAPKEGEAGAAKEAAPKEGAAKKAAAPKK